MIVGAAAPISGVEFVRIYLIEMHNTSIYGECGGWLMECNLSMECVWMKAMQSVTLYQ